MSDALLTTIISVAATSLIAIVALLSQQANSRAAIRAERERLLERIEREEISRMREKRREQLVDALSELLTTADPQISATIDYGRAVSLIHRLQLLLDRRVPPEENLNRALNRLGKSLHDYVPVHARSIDEKVTETRQLLLAQSEVTECARAVLRFGLPENLPMRAGDDGRTS